MESRMVMAHGERQEHDVELVQVVGWAEVGDAAAVVRERLLPGIDPRAEQRSAGPLEVFAGGDRPANADEERGGCGEEKEGEDKPAEAVELGFNGRHGGLGGA